MTSDNRRLLRLAPAAAAGVIFGMAQVGSGEAERNICSWLPDAGAECLRGTPGIVIYGILALLVVGSLAWFIGFHRTIDLVRNAKRMIPSRHRRLRTIKGTQMWPIIGMAVSGIVFVLCVAWLLANNHAANAELQKTLQRYVLPRHLTENQMATIGAYLKQYEPHRFKMRILKENSETSMYAMDIRKALERGGWEASGYDYVSELREGITYDLREPHPRPQRTAAEEARRPDRLFQNALAAAKVIVAGGSSGGVQGQMPEVVFTVIVGPRSMSDADLIAEQEERERALKLIRGEPD